MSEELPSVTNRPRRFQFSLDSLMLLTAAIGLSIALILVYTKLQRAERELGSLQPISPEEVARQFEASTTFSNFKTKVDDVRYSPNENAFKVEFSWADPATKTMWSTDVKLVSDGFGSYYGKIHSGEFLKAVGGTNEFYFVGVESPSPLKAK